MTRASAYYKESSSMTGVMEIRGTFRDVSAGKLENRETDDNRRMSP